MFRRETKASLMLVMRVGFPSPELRKVPDISVAVFQDWTQRTAEVIAARSAFSLGIGAFSATINDDPPDSRFLPWGAGAVGAPPGSPDTLLLIRGDVHCRTERSCP